jgi:hypothetical protein
MKSPTPLPFEGATAENAYSWSGSLLGLPGVPEERKIAAAGRAVNFRLSCNRVPKGLVQQLPASITLGGGVETL